MERAHKHASDAKRAEEPGELPYRERLSADVKDIFWAVIAVVSLHALGVALTALQNPILQVAGLALSLCALTIWVSAEIGPPGGKPENRVGEKILRRLGCNDSPRSQYIPLQRLLFDGAIMIPAMFAAATLTYQQARTPLATLLWAILVFVAAAITSTKKHETRLINSYRDQSVWLTLNESKIRHLSIGGLDKNEWA